MSEMKTSEVLDLAADKIEGAGWTRGSEGWIANTDAGLCLEGALVAAMGRTLFTNSLGPDRITVFEMRACPAYRAVQAYLETESSLWMWNDAQRSANPVIEVLRAAAAVERAKEESLEGSVSKEEVSA